MKQKLIITAIVVLAIGFFGLAGGFTKTVAVEQVVRSVCRNADGVKVVHPDESQNSAAATRLWCELQGKQFGYTLNDEWQGEAECDHKPFTDNKAVLYGYCEYKTVFALRRTAMLVIGGAITYLLLLARKYR